MGLCENAQEVVDPYLFLNRRLTSDVYLGVADVFAPDGAPCDHLVVMRRLPARRRLSSLVSAGVRADECVRDVARTVAAFHAKAAAAPKEVATRDAVRRNWEDNLDVLRGHVSHVIDRDEFDAVALLAERYLAGRETLFTARIDGGYVRDGHGDLLADDIFCLDDGPRILDCLDFADHYRYGDILLDVAFLAMDLERLGAPDLSARFLDWYQEFSGEHHPLSLAHHYVAYRAHVRAKVACLRAGQGAADEVQLARVFHALTLRHLQTARVRLVLVGGLPGTGKSTIAGGLSDTRDWALLRSDVIRKDLGPPRTW